MSKLVELARPLNAILLLLTGLVSFLLLRGFPSAGRTIHVLLTLLLVFTGGNYLNDFFDREIDRTAHPKRPIPAGKIRAGSVAGLGVLWLVLGTVLSAFLGLLPFLIALFSCVLLVLYDRWMKGWPLVGNLAVALLSGLVFLFVGASLGRTMDLLWPAVLALLFHLGREIVKDIEDVGADRSHGLSTLPSTLGVGRALGIARAVIILLAMVTVIPYLTGTYGLSYLILVLVAVDLPLLLLVFTLGAESRPTAFGRVATFMKYDIFIALVALYLGGSST
jgi:geranylgeranylglycerol-phosphate geranylgeranyltransferase